METIEFMRPRLNGERFRGGSIPLEMLKDIAVLEEMVIEVAKWRFRVENPERQRSPRGFSENIELKLLRIEDGSAIPIIGLFLASSFLPGLDPKIQYFEQANEAIVSAIAAAQNNQQITDHLPEKILGYFDRFGRSLKDGESIAFTSIKNPTPVILNKETRRKLILASPRTQGLTEEIIIRGTVPEVDQEKMSFHIQTFDERKILAPLSENNLETILDAFNGYRNKSTVSLKGVGKFDRQYKLLGFESIEHATPLDQLDVGARIDELRSLKSGWFDGHGVALDGNELDWFSNIFEQKYPDDIPLPRIYPTPDGDLQAEWSINSTDISLKIFLNEHSGEWHQLDLNTDQDESRQLSLEDEDSWSWIVKAIRDLVGRMA